jgi:hypothetical protein
MLWYVALLGVLLPVAVLAQSTLRNEFPSYVATGMSWMIDAGDIREARRIVGGSLFLLCWQAMTEALARTALLQLPIRILIPVSYNALRLSSLRSWAFFPRAVIEDGLPVIPSSCWRIVCYPIFAGRPRVWGAASIPPQPQVGQNRGGSGGASALGDTLPQSTSRCVKYLNDTHDCYKSNWIFCGVKLLVTLVSCVVCMAQFRRQRFHFKLMKVVRER